MISLSQFKHYKTDIISIDYQHWHIFNKLNSVEDALRLNNTELAIQKYKLVIPEFIEHCRDEEVAMLAANYPFIDYHIISHERLLKLFNVMSIKTLNRYTINDLIKAILVHIDDFDIQLANYLKTKNT